MKKAISLVICLVIVLSLVACGGGDVLKGTWTCEDSNYGTVEFTFDGKGKECTYSNDFFEGSGTYVIDGDQVTITLDLWEDAKLYDFSVSDTSLTLTATDDLSPSYDLTKK